MTATGELVGDIENGDVPGSGTRSRRWWWLGGVALVLLVGAAVWFLLANGAQSDDVALGSDVNTAVVQRSDVVLTEELSGSLGYGSVETVSFAASADGVDVFRGLAGGFVTDIVDEGTVINSGDVLYEVNVEPVVVLEGDVPVYRAFNSRMSDGEDVEQLEVALVALGYDPDGDIAIDEDFTSATGDAIELLQEAIGATETGSLVLGSVIFSPSAAFVAEQFVAIGDQVQPGEPIVATSRALSGTVTAIADEGSIVGQGDVLLAVDDKPQVLLIGDVPAYRALQLGVEGSDVEQLQQALVSLGFADAEDMATGEFDDATLAAVLAWQIDVEADPDGVVNVGDVVFRPAPIRVGQRLVSVGDPLQPGTPVMATSASQTFVSVELSTDDQDLVVAGDEVVVVLPSGVREPAVVTEIGTVVQANQQGATYFEMTVTLDNPDAAPNLDEAPVDVEIVSDRADNVLAVPVTALLALAEGGYAVEVVGANGTTLLVAVEPGLFADGFVEVASSGLDADMTVVIP
jgi:multidrug efflux system membrane fusion protein